MKKVLQHLCTIGLGLFCLTPTVLGQTESKDYKIVLEKLDASQNWDLHVKALEGSESLVWVDFNNNGQKDRGESMEGEDDPLGMLLDTYNFNVPVSELKITIYGPVVLLACDDNGLVTIETKGNPGLKQLAASNNSISMVDFSANVNLEFLNLAQNQINRIDLKGLSKLTDLRIGDNAKLSQIDLTHTPKLSQLDISRTRISKLTNGNLSSLTKLNTSGISGFQLELDKLGNLTELALEKCGLEELDLQKLPNLEVLWAPGNKFQNLDFSRCPNLKGLMLKYNQLERADLSKNRALRLAYFENNSLQEITFASEDNSLKVLDCSGNTDLSSINTRALKALKALQMDGTNVTSIDLSQNILLEELTASGNKLKQIDLTKNEKLETLMLSGCTLRELNLSANKALKTLYCNDNEISTLDLGACTLLEAIYCHNNKLQELTLHSPALTSVSCYGNKIKKAEMDKLIASLPKTNQGEFVVVDLAMQGQDNECTTTQVNNAKAKGWIAMNKNSGGKELLPYAGQADDSVWQLEYTEPIVYPTVASNSFTIQGAEGRPYTIYSLQGYVAKQGVSTSTQCRITTHDLPSGGYLVKVEGVSRPYQLRIVR